MPQLPIGTKRAHMPQTVFIAIWEHKHGEDMSVHSTRGAAWTQCVEWARGALEVQQDNSYENYTDEDLFWAWPEITGDTEFLTIRETTLKD